MNKLNNKEKKLWEDCLKETIPSPPSKDESWILLEKQIQIHDQKPFYRKLFNYKPKLNHFRQNFIYATIVLLIILSIPKISDILNTQHIITDKGVNNKNINLPDGTRILLNADSKISYYKNYNFNNREVFLDGEAYFDVVKSNTPFIISTNFAQITVLGTKFNIKSRVDNFEAGVNEGTIKIENKNNSLLIDSGKCVAIKKKDMLMIQMEMPDEIINNYPGWLNNKIFCNKTSLEHICEEIERIYNIKIVFTKNSHKKITLSGVIDFDKNNLNSVLSSISLLTQREFKLKGDKYIIL